MAAQFVPFQCKNVRFGDDKFEWDKFNICKLVFGLKEMLWYRVVSVVLYGSAVFSKFVS